VCHEDKGTTDGDWEGVWGTTDGDWEEGVGAGFGWGGGSLRGGVVRVTDWEVVWQWAGWCLGTHGVDGAPKLMLDRRTYVW
jgi:hypothetical protein